MTIYIVCGIILITSIIKFTINKNKNIDIVYTWVESNEEFQKEKQYWYNKENNKNLNDEIIRYIDNEELRYSLRSIEKYFPNYNKIYLVVKNDQFPKYLKQKHPRLKVIKHSDIIPKEYLPTFNSMAIECYLHHIPGLTKNYIYLNDDLFFLHPTNIEYFLDKDNKPVNLVCVSKYKYNKLNKEIDINKYNIIDGIFFNNYLLDKLYSIEEGGRYHISHVPKIFNKDYDYYIENMFKNCYIENNNVNMFDATGMSKFRKNTNLFLVALVKNYIYNYCFGCNFKNTSCLYIENDTNNNKLQNLNTNKRFMCIQSVGKNNKDRYFDLMNNLFPNKSSFEI